MILVTSKELAIIRFLNDFRFSRTGVLEALFFDGISTAKRQCQKRLKTLYSYGYLRRYKLGIRGQYVYFLSGKSLEVLRLNGIKTFSLVEHFSWGTYKHEDMIQSTVVEFKRFGLDRIESTRNLMSSHGVHVSIVPDLGVRIRDDFIVAVEVELSRKNHRRITNKLRKLNEIKLFKTVLYICERESTRAVFLREYRKIENPFYNLVLVRVDDFFNDSKAIVQQLVNQANGVFDA